MRRYIFLVLMMIDGVVTGCGKSADTNRAMQAPGTGEQGIETPYPATNAGTTDVPNPFGQPSAPTRAEHTTAPDNQADSGAAPPQESTVTDVEAVTGPHGPFPTSSSAATSTDQSTAPTTPPAEVPSSPRGPFGPFPTSQ